MEVLVYHREVEEGDFPDCCVRCGAGRTVLVPVVLTTRIPVLGGSVQYQEVELPFCPAHVKPPLVSLNYPAARAFTEKGVVVTNVAPAFVGALEEHREEARRRRRRRGEPEGPPARRVQPAAPPKPSPERERAYRLFVIGMIAAALLAGAAIGGIVILAGKINPSAAATRPQAPESPNAPWGGNRGR